MQTVGARESRKAPSGKRITVVEMGLSTYYFFRGPRSHRQVMVSVRHPFYARFREEEALRKANDNSWLGTFLRNDENFFRRIRRT